MIFTCISIKKVFKDLLFINFNRWDVILLSVVPVLINLFILIYSTFSFNKNRVNTFFSIFVLVLTIWQSCNGLTRLSSDSSIAESFYKISEIAILFVVLFGNLFVFRLTDLYKKVSDAFFFLFFIFPPIVFFICIELKLDTFAVLHSSNFNWIINPKPTTVMLVIYFWLSVAALVMLLALWFSYFRVKNEIIKKKQFLLLAIGFTFPVLWGIIAEVVFPLVLGWNVIPLTEAFATCFSVTALIAINKYKMLEYSPKHQWQLIIESMNEGILIVNNDERIMFANRAFCKLSGYEFEEISGKIASDLFIHDAEAKAMIKNNIELRKNDVSTQYEIQLKTKQGDNIWMLISGTPYKDMNGNTIGSIGLHTNINQIKEANRSLVNINSELELYIYKASHDLRSPLASILGLIYVWKSETTDPKSIEYLNMLEDTGKKLDYTLSELVKAMKIKGIKEFEDNIDFNNLVRDVLVKFAHYPGFDKLRIEKTITVERNFISNKFIIETILQNLIENVIKYQKFTISDPFLNINIKEVDGKIIIAISDNGIGIKDSMQAKVFDMYFRGTLDAKGSGLGLYLVKKSIEKLNGKIELNSEEGRGTTFTITLG